VTSRCSVTEPISSGAVRGEHDGKTVYTFTIYLQGPGETVFLRRLIPRPRAAVNSCTKGGPWHSCCGDAKAAGSFAGGEGQLWGYRRFDRANVAAAMPKRAESARQ